MAAINVQKTGIEVAVTHIAFGTDQYKPNGAEIGLQHEMMRVAIAGGGKVSPTQIQVHAEAIAPTGSPFWSGEIGFYAGETLFAIYSKPDQPILYFADDSVTTVSYTLGLTALPADSVTVLVDPNVNTAIQLIGAHETAGDPHPQYLTKSRGDASYFHKLPAVISSDTDCDTLLDTGVRDVSVANDRGVIAATRLPAGADGYGTLTTENGGQFVRQVYTEATIAHRTWQRSGYLDADKPFEGHDWKLLWDSTTFNPEVKQDKLGYTPVQQGTGIGQSFVTVKIGAVGDQLKATVDQRDLGNFVFQDGLDDTLKSYLSLAGGSVSGQLQVSGSIGTISSDKPGRPTIEIMGKDKADEAYMTFHRPGVFATHFGLDANNDLSVGGYSMGNKAYKLWHAGNFDPSSKASGKDFNMVWTGVGGQPAWLLGGNLPGDIKVFNPSNFNVNYANSANYASSAGNANTWQGFPLRFAENPAGNQPYYILAIEAGHSEFSIYNRTALAVGSAMSAVYANQLSGSGLQNQSIGGYLVNKNHTNPEAGGAWELRGFAYDFGSGGDGGIGTRTALWQRVA